MRHFPESQRLIVLPKDTDRLQVKCSDPPRHWSIIICPLQLALATVLASLYPIIPLTLSDHTANPILRLLS